MNLPSGLTPDAGAYLTEAAAEILSEQGVTDTSSKAEIKAATHKNMLAIIQRASDKQRATVAKVLDGSPESNLLISGMAALVQAKAKRDQAMQHAKRAIYEEIARTELMLNPL